MKNFSTETLKFFAWIDLQRTQGKLNYGTIQLYGDTYMGELDENGKACGEGVLKWSNGTVKKGTWKNNKIHGYGNVFFVSSKVDPNGQREIGEWKEGRKHGKIT